MRLLAALAIALGAASCTTTKIEFDGECVLRSYDFITWTINREVHCVLPARHWYEEQIDDEKPDYLIDRIPLNPHTWGDDED